MGARRRDRARQWWGAAAAVSLAAALLSCAPAGSAADGALRGRVVGVTDGDTLTLLTDDRRVVTVRLAEIDAPERGQPYGARAKKALSDLAMFRRASVRTSGLDRYGRTLGRVAVRGRDVNAELVRGGSAWAYRAYLTDASLLRAEQDARAARRGLWSLDARETQAPWAWRGGARAPAAQGLAALPAAGFSCGPPRSCAYMRSCAEARFHLRQCGQSGLDGDGDGRPCEGLC